MMEALQPGVETLKWSSEGINQFIAICMKNVTQVDVLVKKMQDNVCKIRAIMVTWNKPLFERKKT